MKADEEDKQDRLPSVSGPSLGQANLSAPPEVEGYEILRVLETAEAMREIGGRLEEIPGEDRLSVSTETRGPAPGRLENCQARHGLQAGGRPF